MATLQRRRIWAAVLWTAAAAAFEGRPERDNEADKDPLICSLSSRYLRVVGLL